MKYIKKINEYRGQLEIPFDKKHPLYDKPPHVHVLDLMEELYRMSKQKHHYYYSNNNDIESFIDQAYDEAKSLYKEYVSMNNYPYCALVEMLKEYHPSDNKELYDEKFLNELEEDENLIDNVYVEDLYSILSDKGRDILYNEILDICFDSDVEEFDIKYILKESMDEDNLIPVWRAISYDKGDNLDIYSKALEKYSGVGLYWSYDKNKAEPYYGGGKYSETFILHGKVKPEYINWPQTLYKSAYSLKEEKEVEVKEGTEVLIYKITTYKDNKELPLKKEIVVPV